MSTNPFNKISVNYNRLTKSEKNTCNLILNNPQAIIDYSITEAAKIYQVSSASIQRVAKKIGYKGYSELKYALELYFYQNQENKKDDKLSNQIFDIYSSTLLEWKKEFDNDKIIKLVHLIHDKNVKTIGIGNSGLAASHLVYSLYMYGKWSEAIDNATKIDYLEYGVQENALYILFSISGKLVNINQVKRWKKKGVTVVLITANEHAPIQNEVDLNIVLPTLPIIINKSSHNILDNRTNFYILIDIILLYYLSIYHPQISNS